jgi:hypothetical protein
MSRELLQEFPHFFLRLAPSMQACGTQASAALDFRPPGRTQPRCVSLTMNNRELFCPSPQVVHGPGFQYVNEVSGSIDPYRAMPLLVISNTLNANGLATSAPRFWGNSSIVARSFLTFLALPAFAARRAPVSECGTPLGPVQGLLASEVCR